MGLVEWKTFQVKPINTNKKLTILVKYEAHLINAIYNQEHEILEINLLFKNFIKVVKKRIYEINIKLL